MPTPLVVFADDWGRHPSSCQHLVRHLLPGRQVVWVNTIGTRPPRLDWGTAKRVAGKLGEWFGWSRDRKGAAAGRPGELVGSPAAAPLRSRLQPEPTVVAPKMWPSFASTATRRLNRTLLVRALRPVFESLPEPPVVVTTLPLVADLPGRLPAARWVYYCVDDFSVWPGYDGATMLRMERDLVPHLSAAVAVSDTLVAHLHALGVSATLLTHGVDLDRWQAPAADPPAELAGLAGPITLFWGVIDRRLDLAFVRHLGEHVPGTLLLVGPREDPDPALFAIPNVAVRPAVPFDRLPQLAAHVAVLVMPYADAPVTRAMQPLKLKEYLATGRPAVVRDLPSTRPWADACDVAATPEAFTAAVLARLADGVPDAQRLARGRLASESWATKAMAFEKSVTGTDFSARDGKSDV